MEIWTLDHPQHGRLELRQGFDAEFLADDAGWPQPEGDDVVDGSAASPGGRTGERAPLDAPLRDRVRARVTNPPLRLQVRIDGEVTGRYPRTGVGEVRLKNPKTEKDGFSTVESNPASNLRRLRVQANALGDILSVQFREGSSVVEFDPPPGSRGARRQAAMESSSVKRILYPLMGGLGKAGGAILVLALFPLLAKLLPDWQVDLPEFHLPRIRLPVPTMPQIHLPVPRLPEWEIDVPSLPGWLRTVLEHDEVWKPVLLGLVLGVVAVRNHRRSERQKAAWAAERAVAGEARVGQSSSTSRS